MMRFARSLMCVVALAVAPAACASHPDCYTTVSKQVPVGSSARLSDVPRAPSGQLDFDGFLWNLPPEFGSTSDASSATVRLQEGPVLEITLANGQVAQATLIGCK